MSIQSNNNNEYNSSSFITILKKGLDDHASNRLSMFENTFKIRDKNCELDKI